MVDSKATESCITHLTRLRAREARSGGPSQRSLPNERKNAANCTSLPSTATARPLPLGRPRTANRGIVRSEACGQRFASSLASRGLQVERPPCCKSLARPRACGLEDRAMSRVHRACVDTLRHPEVAAQVAAVRAACLLSPGAPSTSTASQLLGHLTRMGKVSRPSGSHRSSREPELGGATPAVAGQTRHPPPDARNVDLLRSARVHRRLNVTLVGPGAGE